jgi:hypothetical protein
MAWQDVGPSADITALIAYQLGRLTKIVEQKQAAPQPKPRGRRPHRVTVKLTLSATPATS